MNLLNLFTFGASDRYNKRKFNKLWEERNSSYAEVLLESAEIDYIILQNYIFVEDTKNMVDKLTRIGFEALEEYPYKSMFEDFSYAMYNDKYNVALNMYSSNSKKVVLLSYDIAYDTSLTGSNELDAFLSCVRNLEGKVK